MRSSKTSTTNNKKTLQEQHFTRQEINLLKSKPWWIANTQTPYMIKFTTHQNCILMKCTNLTHLFVKRFDEKEIKQDQEIYAKGLTVKDFKHLLEFFQGYLSQRDDKAKYKFQQNTQQAWLDFKFQKLIQFFPFIWKFRLCKVQCDIKQLICNEIINPMSFALERQSRRQEILRKKTQIMQKDYVKRLTDTEKKMYKSPFIQSQDEWKVMCKKQQGMYNNVSGFNKQMMFPYVFDNFVSFAVKEYLKPFIEQKPKVPIQTLLQAKHNPPQKSSSSKSRPPPIYNDTNDDQVMQYKLKYTKQDEKKAKTKKNDKHLGGIDFL